MGGGVDGLRAQPRRRAPRGRHLGADGRELQAAHVAPPSGLLERRAVRPRRRSRTQLWRAASTTRRTNRVANVNQDLDLPWLAGVGGAGPRVHGGERYSRRPRGHLRRPRDRASASSEVLAGSLPYHGHRARRPVWRRCPRRVRHYVTLQWVRVDLREGVRRSLLHVPPEPAGAEQPAARLALRPGHGRRRGRARGARAATAPPRCPCIWSTSFPSSPSTAAPVATGRRGRMGSDAARGRRAGGAGRLDHDRATTT